MTPVSIVTGFLGSGKTTLISGILRDPAFARTAVIVNEFGEIGLDHELIATGNETFLALTTGCLCCSVRSDLIETLLELRERAGGLFDRVLIETSGLADPAPILQALMTDPVVSKTHVIDTMVTVVDSLLGEMTLERHPEARRQIALADHLVFSKTDLGPPAVSLLEKIDDLNAAAPRSHGSAMPPGLLFAGADPAARAARLGMPPEGSTHFRAQHSSGVETGTICRDEPMPALALTMWLQALAEHCGDRLLRMKGLIAIGEMPGRPAIVHGVQHVFSAPEFLECWPSGNEQTRVVFIYRDIPKYFPARLLDAIEQEVRDELAQKAA